MSEVVGVLQRHPGAGRPLGRRPSGRSSTCSRGSSTARTCSAPTARSRTRGAATPPRRSASSTTPGARRACSGSRAPAPTWRRSRRPAFAALRLDELLPAARARRDGRRDDGRLPPAQRVRSRPAAAVDRDAAARVRPGGARRSHASRRGHRADLVAGRPRLAEEAFGDEAVWLDYQRPGFEMSQADRGAARREHPCRAGRAAREARARHLGRDERGRATARRSSS